MLPIKIKKPQATLVAFFSLACALTEIRTPVLSLKGLRPGPLDDEGNGRNSIILVGQGQILRFLSGGRV